MTELAEIHRIIALPRRTHTPEFIDTLVEGLSEDLRLNPKAKLRPVQAISLYELGTEGGLAGAIRVGGGKSLLTFLSSVVLGSARAILLLPASLIAKTEHERMIYAKDWKVDRGLRLMSYEMLGRVNAAEMLQQYRPDLIIADECHRLKNPRAAVTRRVARYMAQYPETRFVGVSGTIVKHSLKDYAHIFAWALKAKSPVPIKREEVEAWAEILDSNDEDWMRRKDDTPLLPLGEPVREGFRRRLAETPGVVISSGKRGCEASLLIRGVDYDVAAQTETNFKLLRDKMELSTGWALAGPLEVWRHARELALGFHYEWTEHAPDEWLDARREWAKFVRGIISRSKTFDSELHIANAIDAGILSDGGRLNDWRNIKDSFKPITKAVWHDDSALNVCAIWAEKFGPGIIWTSHDLFARELAKRTNLSFYGPGGLDSKGQKVDTVSGKESIIASIHANATGRNLQMFTRSLIASAEGGADRNEQLLGRTHREGQTADEVSYDVLLGCRENLKAMHDARNGARMIQETTGLDQLLLNCDWDIPDFDPADVYAPGWRWGKGEIEGHDE